MNMYVPPSGLLGVIDNKKISSFNKKFSNTPLKMGVVIKCYETDHKESVSKIVPEYDIVTSELNQDMGQKFVKYPHCISTDTFGGIADFFEYKLRPSEENFEETHSFAKQDGSVVLILCLDGSSDKAIIIGGVQNILRESTLTKENEMHMEGEYNGLNWQINKDGEFTITFKSKTTNKREYEDEDAGGTHVKMDKEGSFDVNTNLEGDDATSFKIDKTAKDINSIAGNNITATAKKDIIQTAEANIKATAKASIEFAAEGSAKYTSKSSLDIEGKSIVNIKGGNVMIEAQSGVTIKASSVTIKASSVLIGTGAKPAVTPDTQFIGTGNHGAPVVCNAVGPYSGSVSIAT